MKRFKNMSVFVRWFLSYLTMLGLAIVLSIGLYFYSYNIISQQAEQVNHTMLEKLQIEVDGYFSEARKTTISLILDGDVQNALKVQKDFSISDRETLYRIYTEINNHQVASEKLSHTFIYFWNGDTVISENGHMDGRLFYDLYYQNDHMDYEGFQNLLKQNWDGGITIVTGKNERNELLFLQNAFPRGVLKPDATFGIGMSEDIMTDWMNRMRWDDSSQLLLISQGSVICGDRELGDGLLKEQGTDLTALSEIHQVNLGEQTYRLTAVPSKELDAFYVTLTPIYAIQRSAKKIQTFTMAGLLICITLGVFAAYILTGLNYNSLRNIMDAFGGYKKGQEEANEYQWLQQQTIRFLEEHQAIKRRFYNNEKILRDQYLYRLVTLPYDERNLNMKDFSLASSLSGTNNLVILLCLRYEDGSPWQMEVERGLFRFIIANVMEELLEEEYHLEVVDLMDSFACVINGDKAALDSRDYLENMLNQFDEFMNQRMKLEISAMCGSPQRGLEGIYPSYLMAREAWEYRDHMGYHSVIWYDDIKNRHTLYEYPMETEQRIINAIKAGQKENACRWMDEVIETNYCHREITQDMKKYLLSELMGTVMKGTEQSGGTLFISKVKEMGSLPAYATEEKVRQYFHELIIGLCKEIRENENDKRDGKQLGSQVMEYVQQNYQDPDLNISITALHFNMTPSYLSALFKEETGLSLLDYINHTRVEHVKELLEEGWNLTEISERTGFRSSGALIRVFKKETGVTPGQMKKIKS